MCKADCKTPCCAAPACGKQTERTAQRCAAVKIPVGLRDDAAKIGPSYNMEASFDGKTWFEVGPVTAMEGLDDAIGGLPTYQYPHDLPEASAPVSWPQIQQAHEAARSQSAMHEACAIASALASESVMDSDQEPLKALMRHVGAHEHATLQLLKLVGRIGLRQWFDGEFVVLSKADARALHDAALNSCMDMRSIDPLAIAIEKADQ